MSKHAKSKALEKAKGGENEYTQHANASMRKGTKRPESGPWPVAKNYTSPTGSKHRIGSSKHKYWMDIERSGKEQKKYHD